MRFIILITVLLSGCHSVVTTEDMVRSRYLCEKNNSALMYVVVTGRSYKVRCSNGGIYTLWK